MKRIKITSKFKYASRGLKYLWQHEISFRWQLMIALVIQLIALIIKLDIVIWGLATFISAVVLCAEAFNTSIEKLLDVVEPRLSPQIEILKNILSAAVLVVTIGALIIGLVVVINLVLSLNN